MPNITFGEIIRLIMGVELCISQSILTSVFVMTSYLYFSWITHGGWRKIVMVVTTYLLVKKAIIILQITDHASGRYTKLIRSILKVYIWSPFFRTILKIEFSNWKLSQTNFVRLPMELYENLILTQRSYGILMSVGKLFQIVSDILEFIKRW